MPLPIFHLHWLSNGPSFVDEEGGPSLTSILVAVVLVLLACIGIASL